jgi:SWI/SNF-related matrix-associated actin-dependent regulator 1 of chromatin subfamily A
MNAITVIKRGERWLALFHWSAAIKDRVKAAGFKFDSARKEWWTTDATVAATFNGAAPAPQNDYKSSIAPQIVTNGIPAPDGLEYLPFQREGIATLCTRKYALLADEMGLGKTIQAIGLINAKPDIERILIICPASLKRNWWNELKTWCVRPMTVHIISPGSDWQPCDIVILNYEQVAKYRDCIDKVAWDLLVVDESHYLKSPKSQRTQAIVGKWDEDKSNRVFPIRATRKLWMTGTPILNRPRELWTCLRALDREGLGSDWHGYHTRYCDAYQDMHGWQLDGASNLEELQDRLRKSIMIRRKKMDVLKDLPAKRRQVILLPSETPRTKEALAREREQSIINVELKLDDLRRLEEISRNKENYKNAVQMLADYETVAFNQTAKIRHQTALAKLPGAMDYLVNVLASEKAIVVFAHHHDVIDNLIEGLAEYGVVKIDGRDAPDDRQKAVDAFQSDPGIRVIVGSIGAMGVGWTLTAASYVAFVELDWVPGNLAQAEDRLHRIGQAESVLIQHLMLEGSFDGRMAKTVIHKMDVIERAVG